MRSRPRSIFGALSGICLAVTLALWALGGAHRGWTRTSRPVEKTDEVTGLQYREYERRFQPGIDFLAGGLLIGTGLAGAAWVAGRRSPRRGL
jgi:hypothetical protein